MKKSLRYRFHSGKNWKFFYYSKNIARRLVPRWVYNLVFPLRCKCLMKGQNMEYLMDRVNYYCKLDEERELPTEVGAMSRIKDGHPAVYYHDFFRTHRFFGKEMRGAMLPGDITYVPDFPTFLKSRPIKGDNRNSVVLKLCRVRHFVFLKDTIKFEDKEDKVIFRGGVIQPHRRLFMQKFFGHPLVDACEVTKRPSSNPPEWKRPPMTLYDHLKYKFIMSLEGNDVASNLKWVMSSNSIAVMPKPTYETWFMEGRLIPNYHYIEIKPDYSDFEERIKYYIEHTDEANEIIKHAHEYVAQFMDRRREDLLEILVMKKYLKMTKQV
ncbi:MAG: lipopolysaccharide biosynthesis protein [Paludibacteraceae bacterium]|nr:lipopolysaccharide biosynthesis protein [Paludibacteraceae bacterium]